MTSELVRTVIGVVEEVRLNTRDLTQVDYVGIARLMEKAILADMVEAVRCEKMDDVSGLIDFLLGCLDSDERRAYDFRLDVPSLASLIAREMHDFKFLLEAVPKVYYAITDGRISKPNTLPDQVIAVAEECRRPQNLQEASASLAEACETLVHFLDVEGVI